MDITPCTPVAVVGPRSGSLRSWTRSGPAHANEHVTRLTLEAPAAGTERLPVPARGARSGAPGDALALPGEPARRAKDG